MVQQPRTTDPEPASSFLTRPLVLCLIALAFSLPVLLPPVLPLADIGGHLGRFAIQLDAGRDPQLAQWYTFRWQLLPNLGSDLLVELLAPAFGLEPTIRAIVMLAVFLQALGMLLVARTVHGRITPFAILALPLIYGHSFVYGFLNFILSLGLVWCSLALWLVLSRPDRPGIRRWLVFAFVATIVWVCHLVGWALLFILLGGQEFARQLERKGGIIPAAIACIAPLSFMLAPWVVKFATFQPATGSGPSSGFFRFTEKFNELFQVMRDQSHTFDTLSFEILAVVIIWSLVTRFTKLDRGLALAALATAVCVVLIPDQLLGSYFADQRLHEPTLEFALLSIGFSEQAPRRLGRILLGGAVLFSGARFVSNSISLVQLGNVSAQELKVLDQLPRHAELVFIRTVTCPPPMVWTIDRRRHLGGYAIARRHAFSNDQWQLAGAQLLRIHNPRVGRFMTDDTQIAYATDCMRRKGVLSQIAEIPAVVPYLWVSWSVAPKPLEQWEPVAQGGDSILYRRRAGS